MWEPRQPIPGRRPDRFRPRHCPYEECPAHLTEKDYRATYKGSYRRKRDPHRPIPRFRCTTCTRTFSREAFGTTYYLKRPELLLPVANLLISGCAHRQIARHLDCAPSTVTRLSVRLGRHAHRFLELSIARLGEIGEAVALDHFEAFVRSQQERLGIATAVGQHSWYVYALQGAGYLRLGGRSRRKRALKRQPISPPPGAVVDSTRKTLEYLLRYAPGGLALCTDEHPAYPVAVRQLGPHIRHRAYPNPDRSPGGDATVARVRARAMFAVDLLHKLLRHSQAHHRRETIAFGRKRASVLGRAALFAVWRNMIKRVSERRPTRLTPAMRVGLTSRPWTWAEVCAERLFERRIARITA